MFLRIHRRSGLRGKERRGRRGQRGPRGRRERRGRWEQRERWEQRALRELSNVLEPHGARSDRGGRCSVRTQRAHGGCNRPGTPLPRHKRSLPEGNNQILLFKFFTLIFYPL